MPGPAGNWSERPGRSRRTSGNEATTGYHERPRPIDGNPHWRDRLPDVSLGLLLVVASVSVFAPLSGWLAGQRQRNVPLWAIFGAVLGPIAPGLLLSAPPGRCAACRWPVTGWSRQCAACGADVESGSLEEPAALESPAEPMARPMPDPAGPRPALRLVADATAPPSATRARKGRAAAAVRAEDDAPGSADRRRSGDPVRVMDDSTWTPHKDATELGHRPAERPAPDGGVSHAAPPPTAVAILGSGVYIGGNRSLQPGNRYLLARVGTDLQILGPVHQNPSTLADHVMLAAVDAFVLGDRLMISARDPRLDIAMAFISLTFERGVDIETAIGDPERAADAR